MGESMTFINCVRLAARNVKFLKPWVIKGKKGWKCEGSFADIMTY